MLNRMMHGAERMAAALAAAGAATLLLGLQPVPAQITPPDQSESCIPKGDSDPTHGWNPLHIVKRDGREVPTAKSLASQKRNQTSQIVLDPVRNVQVGFISGVTLEAPADTEDWTVVQTRTCPPARWAGAMAYDPLNDEIVLWGGTMSIDGPTNDTWIYDTTKRDWHKLVSGSAEMRNLRAAVGALRDDLERLRWDSWKAVEWLITGKEGAEPPSALAARLESIGKELASAGALAAAAEAGLAGYEKSQAAAAGSWLASAGAKLASLDNQFDQETPDGLEGAYRALLALRADVGSAVDSLLAAPPSRYFVALTYDAAQQALVLDSSTDKDYGDRWIYRLAERRWERISPAPGRAVARNEPTGEFVLRDAATVADLRRWQEQTSAWAAALPPNTWVIAPRHGTGRPNWGRSWSSLVYDPDREQLYYRDGGHGSYQGNVTDHYDVRTGRWFRSDVEEVPSSRIMGTYFGWGRGYNYAPWAIHTYKWSLFYNPLTGHLQRRGFHTPNTPVDGNVNDYDPDQGKWSKQPATVNFVGHIIPGATDGILSVRGWTRYSGLPSATVGYETASGFKKWTNAGAIPFPGPNHDDAYGFAFDPHRQRAMYYGGEDATLGLYVLDVRADKPKWVKLDVSVDGAPAIPPAYREWIYIPKHDMFLTMAWQPGGSKTAPQLWSFDPKTNVFRPVNLAFGPGVAVGTKAGHLHAAAVASGLAYDPVSDVAFYIHTALSPPTMFAFRYVPAGGG